MVFSINFACFFFFTTLCFTDFQITPQRVLNAHQRVENAHARHASWVEIPFSDSSVKDKLFVWECKAFFDSQRNLFDFKTYYHKVKSKFHANIEDGMSSRCRIILFDAINVS
jgi:hypothetical protein